MFISDLNYLETVSADVTGGGYINDVVAFSKIKQTNFNYTKQNAAAYAKSSYNIKTGGATAVAYNTNSTKQSNDVN